MTLKFNYRFLLFTFFIFVNLSYSQQKDSTVSNTAEFNEAIKKAIPGTTITLKNGTYNNVYLQVHGFGSKNLPITVQAETPGKVLITGDSKLSISGEYMIVSGLWFKNGTPTGKEVITFKKDSKNVANNCRLTNCTISYFNPTDKSIENHWVDLWGKNNRVDHNNFTGKTNGGTTLVVWLKGEEHIENNHQIDHNYFGERPELGVNGGETIRIGTSENSMKSSKTIVEYNTFKQCNGEIEIISNKSCNNIYRNNIFIECEGALTLRHGNGALVENNVFVGNNKPRVGGIRIIGEDHIIRNNFLIGISGDDYRSPIVLMNGVPNSPLNRYFQVKNATIQNNTLINCSAVLFGAGKDAEKSLAPINSVFANNLISNTTGATIMNANDAISGISFSTNFMESTSDVDSRYFTKTNIDWALLGSLPMPTENNNILKTAKKIANSPDVDITNSKRSPFVAGAFNLNNTIVPEAITTKSGPNWKPLIEKPVINPISKIIEIQPGLETLSKALKKVNSGDKILLNPGTYLVSKTMKISGNITIEGKEDASKIIIKANDDVEKPLSYFFRITEDSSVSLKNLTLNGESKEYVKYAVVSPAENEGKLYNLFIDKCTFINFKNTNGGTIFKAYIGTLADTISITNSTFEDSYRGLNLSYEKDPIGKVNAKHLLIHSTSFKNIEEFAINYINSGTIGTNIEGDLKITNCVFSKIYNTEKGYTIKTKGIPNVTITNTVFENSYQQKTPINLSGFGNSISNCLVSDNGYIKTSKGAQSNNILYKSAKWDDKNLFIPSKKSPLLKENNGIELIGLIPNK